MSSRRSDLAETGLDADVDDLNDNDWAGVPENEHIGDNRDHQDVEPEKTCVDYGGLNDEDESGEHNYAIEEAVRRPGNVKVETMKVYHFFLTVACTHFCPIYFLGIYFHHSQCSC